jgi:CBS domain containing-hemolysin-like protein
MSEYLPGLAWLVVLLAANAFFVGAEFAVISARRSQIEPRAAAGSRAAKTTLWAMEHATLMLATSQLGITVCSLLILTVSEPAIHHLLEYPLGLTPLSADLISVSAFVVALVLVTYLHVVFGEMVPKNLSFSVPDRAALLLAPPLVFVSRVVRPVIAALNWVANTVLRLFGVDPKDEATSTFTLEEVAGIVAQSQREGTLHDTSGTLKGAFEFTDKTVADDLPARHGDPRGRPPGRRRARPLALRHHQPRRSPRRIPTHEGRDGHPRRGLPSARAGQTNPTPHRRAP